MNTGIKQIECPQCNHTQDNVWQFCQKCLYNLHYKALNTISTPGWVQTSNTLLSKHGSKMDPNKEREIQDRVEAEKMQELKNSARARNWEEGRKRNWRADKPYFMKKMKEKNV